MPKVTARQCRFTGKMFKLGEEKKFATHLKKIRADQKEHRWQKRAAGEFKEWVLNAQNTIKTPEELSAFIIENAAHMSRAAFPNSWRRNHHRGSIDIELKYFNLNLTFRDSCSNSHSAPRGKSKNWGSEVGLPIGYKGWSGRLEFAYKGEDDFFREALEKMSIHTGTGGGGHRDESGYAQMGFGVTVWADDWPAMYEAHRMQQVFDTLAGN